MMQGSALRDQYNYSSVGRPPFSARRGFALGSTAANSSDTCTFNTNDTASSVATVTFSEPRSMRPIYERSMPASKPNFSCDIERATRKRRRFQPIVLRTSIATQSHKYGLTIDGLLVPY